MWTSVDNYLAQINNSNSVRSSFRRICLTFSLLVVVGVFWGLKLTGITMAGDAFCGIDEHVHGETCITAELICGQEELPEHHHTEDCISKILTCELTEQEGHTHSDACLGHPLLCTEEESPGHTHSATCYALVAQCGIDLSEEHLHEDSCMALILTCEVPESEGHTHSEECFAEETELQCGKEEAEEHFHTEDCYTVEENTFLCQLEETDGHTHEESCYLDNGRCILEEHIHTENCYSDVNADLETIDDWEDSLAGLIRSPSTAENILMVARSQLGVAESYRNFQVDDAGIRRGINRYGQWYGNDYGDWSAMFAGFCLEYAGVDYVPLNGGPEAMRLEWEQWELYTPKEDFTPEAGYLLFLDKNLDGAADSMAIITDLEENVLFVIEGDTSQQVTKIGEIELTPEFTPLFEEESGAPIDAVLETLYAIEDPVVMGYGVVPFEPGLMLLPEGGASVYAPRRTIWLDGTNGGIMSLNGSANTAYSAEEGKTFTLPTEWQSPAKYQYRLRGWYDVINNKYYEPGAEVTVKGNMVFYADWAANTYDIGQFNSQVANTVSTNDFVTVRMFDYGILFNVLSEQASVSFGNNSHTETWSLLTSGKNPYNGAETLNYILRDWDRGSEDISYPKNTNDRNNPTSAGTVFSGLYTNTIADLLFNPYTDVIGKEYLGTGDHLFQLCLDENHEHYGYYYYNSERNAASYNQSAQRFYVYDYLECTRTSSGQGNEGKYSDFLPLNSPYANTNGKQVNTYTYNGVEGEYRGTTHYMYDCRYDTDGSSTRYVGTNFWFGMSVEVDFFLPNKPGTTVIGGYGNQDIYGKDMHFRFSGDDDVWIFVDGTMVLDLGGLHGMETGDINFATGVVTINGTVNQNLSNNLKSIQAGEHTLTLYYLERGSSMSNCAIYFNLAPRFSFNIQKEDVLTRDVLNGAQFSVYTDKACTVPAELWTSKLSHDRNDPSTNVFTVVDGSATMWGMGAGNTYYIKETKGPDDPNYAGLANGVICLTFDKAGTANYEVEIQDTGQGVSNGFTVHGFRIDTESQQAYIVATNAPIWVQETTSIQVKKQWQDQVNHNADKITVYLTVTGQDGTVTRLREVTLSDANGWYYMWDNLPKFWEDGSPVQYGVEEAYISGYYSKVEQVEHYSAWVDKTAFENGKTYLIRSNSGYLATDSNAADTGFVWLNQQAAENSSRAKWTATIKGNTVRLKNGANQYLTFYYNGGSSGYPTDFFASTSGESDASKQYFRYESQNSGLRLYYDGADNKDYYLISSMTSSKKFNYSNKANEALLLTPVIKEEMDLTTGVAFLVNNIPLEKETSLTVKKSWDYGNLPPGTVHEQAQVTVRLLADGKDTGRALTLTLKNGWQGTFLGLPYEDDNGKVITYSILETWDNPYWIPVYGEVTPSSGSPPTYSTTLTNRYLLGMGGPELPSTGTSARMAYVLCGGSMMLTSLVYGILLRRKRERRFK